MELWEAPELPGHDHSTLNTVRRTLRHSLLPVFEAEVSEHLVCTGSNRNCNEWITHIQDSRLESTRIFRSTLSEISFRSSLVLR